MKKLVVICILLVVLTIAGAGIASAQGPKPNSVPGPSGTFSSAFTIQNMGTGVANCMFQFYAGSLVYSSSAFTISIGGSYFTYVPSIVGLANGQYSGVVSCDQQVGAVVNSSSTLSGGSYAGVDGSKLATTWYAPNAFNNYYGFYTNFVVQNATASPITVSVQILNSAGTVVATQNNPSVAAYSSANFEQSGLGGMAVNQPYSARILASGNVAVESNIYGSGATAPQLYMYTPFTAGSTTAYAPVIMKSYYGNNTATTVQNLSASSTVVTVTYGTGLVRTNTLAGHASWVILNYADAGLPSGAAGLTSAKIQSSGAPIVALVNESNAYQRAASYTAFAAGSTTVRAPIVLKRYYKYNTSVTCQNVGGSSTNITILYSNGASSAVNGVGIGGTAFFYQPAVAGLPNGFNGSATITSSGGMPIVCVINEDMNEGADGTALKDMQYAYEGLNQ